MRPALLIAMLCPIFACSPAVKTVAREASPEVVEASLTSAADPANKQRIHDMVQDASATAVDSALARLGAPENRKLIEEIVARITSAMLREIAAPVPQAVQQEREKMAAQAARVAMRAAMEELRRSLPQLIKEMGENQEVRDALAPLSRSAAGGAVKGAADEVTGGEGTGGK